MNKGWSSLREIPYNPDMSTNTVRYDDNEANTTLKGEKLTVMRRRWYRLHPRRRRRRSEGFFTGSSPRAASRPCLPSGVIESPKILQERMAGYFSVVEWDVESPKRASGERASRKRVSVKGVLRRSRSRSQGRVGVVCRSRAKSAHSPLSAITSISSRARCSPGSMAGIHH